MNRWFENFPILGKYFPGKIVLSILMLLLSLLMVVIFPSFDRLLCLFALFFSVFGDFCLNYTPNNRKVTKEGFIVGGVSFIFAHLVFSFAYYFKIDQHGFELVNVGFYTAIVILVLVSAYLIVKSKKRRDHDIFVFGLLYLWMTGINYAIIFSYAFSVKSIESLAMLGGLSFLASDVIIGCERILDYHSKLARELVWWLYPIGQIIMILMA